MGKGADLYWADWWFDFSEHGGELSLMLFEMEKLRFSSLSDVISLMRGTELQLAASRLSI